MRYFIILILSLFVVGCSNASYNEKIGSGPITLSSAAQESFDKYMQSNPAVFALSTDGSTWAFYYCRDDGGCRGTRENSMVPAIKSCQKRSNGKTCKVYALGRSVVWKTELNTGT